MPFLTILFCISHKFCSTKCNSFAACTPFSPLLLLLSLGFDHNCTPLTEENVPKSLPNKPSQSSSITCHNNSVPLYCCLQSLDLFFCRGSASHPSISFPSTTQIHNLSCIITHSTTPESFITHSTFPYGNGCGVSLDSL